MPSALALKIEKIDDSKGEQRDQKPLPLDITWSPKLSIEVSLACEPYWMTLATL
jgi:hypothetical protein